ncbi:hypothetical protein N0V88_005638 [Collariella sp. IMI 366227]|nr:hypothetical protein N0V88_005638 [Collariella sp. IMI 366227]
MEPSLQSPLFTQQVVKAMRALYPEELADRAWDNVGLLQENIDTPSASVPPRVLLTNDLTLSVVEEAIQKKASVIVSYHPFIFRGLTSVTLNDPHQRMVLRLAQHNIAVYSPHTAVDAAPGGVNDWLCSILDRLHLSQSRAVAQPVKGPVPQGFEGAGYGCLVQLNSAIDVQRIAQVFAEGLGMKHLMLARPKTGGINMIKSVAICAGSGGDVLKDTDADLYVTGEMSHHVALRLKMLGKSVITVFHSNSERGFLREVMQGKLQEKLRGEDAAAEVLVSEADEDPFEIWEAAPSGSS